MSMQGLPSRVRGEEVSDVSGWNDGSMTKSTHISSHVPTDRMTAEPSISTSKEVEATRRLGRRSISKLQAVAENSAAAASQGDSLATALTATPTQDATTQQRPPPILRSRRRTSVMHGASRQIALSGLNTGIQDGNIKAARAPTPESPSGSNHSHAHAHGHSLRNLSSVQLLLKRWWRNVIGGGSGVLGECA